MPVSYVGDTPPERRGYLGDNTIRQMALKNLRARDRTAVRRMKREGELEAYLNANLEAVKQHGEMLIRTGVVPQEAWRRAVRVQIHGQSDE